MCIHRLSCFYLFVVNRDAWHYVEVERAKVPLFHKKTKSGNVDVAVFGTVIKVSSVFKI